MLANVRWRGALRRVIAVLFQADFRRGS